MTKPSLRVSVYTTVDKIISSWKGRIRDVEAFLLPAFVSRDPYRFSTRREERRREERNDYFVFLPEIRGNVHRCASLISNFVIGRFLFEKGGEAIVQRLHTGESSLFQGDEFEITEKERERERE